MPRPRVHALEDVLDAAERLLVEQGRAQLTVRSLADHSGVSNGSIYHGFGSLETVIAAAWLRRAQQFLALQAAAVQQALADGHHLGAVQAAADAPARLVEGNPSAARLLVTLSREDLLDDAVAASVAADLRTLDASLASTLRRLAQAVYGREDPGAVDVITLCVVRLPAAMLFGQIRTGRVHPHTRTQLAAAVQAVLDVGPPN